MIGFRTLILAIGLLLTAPAMAAVDGEQIGTVIELEGNVTLTDDNGAAHAAQLSEPIHMNDVLATTGGAKALVQFVDGTEFTLSENAALKVDEYVYDPDDGTKNKARYAVLRGAFLYASGLLTKTDDAPDVKVRTSFGSIGIRGTEFWGGPIDGAYGLLVNEGQVVLTNAVGRVMLGKGQGTSLRGNQYTPSEAKGWQSEKIRRAAESVALKNPGLVAERRLAQKSLNEELLRSRKARLLDRSRDGLKKKLLHKWERPE